MSRVRISSSAPQAPKPRLFDYATPNSEPHEVRAANINAYLIDGPNVLVPKRPQPLNPDLPVVFYGSKPTDGGNLIVEPDQYDVVVADPVAAKYVRPYIGAAELIRGAERWCLWLKELDPKDASSSPVLKERIEAVRSFRLASKAASTRDYPHHHLFRQDGQPHEPYIGIPIHVSETRTYYPVAWFSSDVIASNANFSAVDPDGFAFGLISSSMFLAWQKAVGGRIKSDLRFSKDIVWNNLPLPPVDAATRKKIIDSGQGVLDARALHPQRSLADHYNPLAMDPALVSAHRKLDAAVDRAFGATKKVTTERERQAVLFERYLELTDPLKIVPKE